MIMPSLIITIYVGLMYELKKIGKVFTSIFDGTGPSSYNKRIYRAAVSQRLRNTDLDCLVQAAFGPVALDVAREFHSAEYESYASRLLIVAVLAILITALVGAILITLLGPRLLDKEPTATPDSIAIPSNQNNGRGGSLVPLDRCHDLAAWRLQKNRGLHCKTRSHSTRK